MVKEHTFINVLAYSRPTFGTHGHEEGLGWAETWMRVCSLSILICTKDPSKTLDADKHLADTEAVRS